MSGENDKENTGNISDALNAAANLAQVIPIYDDAVQPIAKETGKALGTIGRCVNAALMPVKGLVWGFEQVEGWINTKVTKRLEDVDPEKIVEPDLSIAGPTIEALKFNGHKEELSDMFASLLASAMNSDKKDLAHPSFVAVISEMTSFEALIFRFVALNDPLASSVLKLKYSDGSSKRIHEHFAPELLDFLGRSSEIGDRELYSAIENLQRHSLIIPQYDRCPSVEGYFDCVLEHDLYKKLVEYSEKQEDDWEVFFEKGTIELTSFGGKFAEACLSE